MIRSTTLLLAGALLTAGCQESRVYGERSFRTGTVYGPADDFPRTTVSGTKPFRDVPNADRDVADRRASDRAISSPPPPRTEITSTPREDQPSSDNPRDEVARAAESNRTESAAPAPAVTRAPEPQPQRPAVAPTPTPAPQPADRPVATTDKPTASHDTDANTTPAAPGTPAGRDPERVARANNARYPDDLKPSDDLRAAATIDRASRTVRLVNYTANEIPGGDLWVNETYVTPLPSIPSGGSAAVPLNQFYDRDGRALPALTDASKLQLQSAGKLYNIPVHSEDLNK